MNVIIATNSLKRQSNHLKFKERVGYVSNLMTNNFSFFWYENPLEDRN